MEDLQRRDSVAGAGSAGGALAGAALVHVAPTKAPNPRKKRSGPESIQQMLQMADFACVVMMGCRFSVRHR